MRDSELVAKAQKGDLEAFDRLVMRHRSRLFQIARDIAGEPEAAQDMVQDALLRAYQALSALRDGDRFGPWANTIVRRVAQGWVRDGRRRERPLETGAVTGVFTGGWSPPAPPTDAQQRIRDALTVLTDRERRVMILHYLEGRTCEEIAAELRISAGTVKSVLHYSRRKVRKECDEMAAAEREWTGPRRLAAWTSGEVPQGKWDPLPLLWRSLAQAVCLAVNKRPKTTAQIAAEVRADAAYISDTVDALTELEVLASPRKGQYLTNFIALDLADWRQVTTRMRQPAAEAAQRMRAAEPRLRAAFENTPLAGAGWTWNDVIWVIYGFIIAQRAISRHLPALCGSDQPPVRPGGYPYWVAGHEFDESMRHAGHLFSIAFYGTDRGEWCIGFFGPMGEQKHHTWVFEPPSFPRTVMYALLDGPLSEEEILTRLGDEPEQRRVALARSVEAGLVERVDARFRLTVPVFTEKDSDLLAPEIDAVARSITREVVGPTWADLEKLFDDMGYHHRRDQYPVWYGFLSHLPMGTAVSFLVEQGVLPERDEIAPAKWNHVAWKGDLPLMRFGTERTAG